MWIFKSSIGRKFIMSLSGLFLIIFLLLHGSINLLAVYDAINVNSEFPTDLYNQACHVMGTNILVQIMVPVLALGFIVHIIYAAWLTLLNRKARGNDRYAIFTRAKIDWASKNMFVLGIIVLGLLVFHLTHFWSKMQLQEWTGGQSAEGYQLVVQTFSNVWVSILYLVWLVAIWFHLTHGFWSAFQTLGWNNKKWFNRLHVISYIVATLLVLIFVVVVVYFGFIYSGPESLNEAIPYAEDTVASLPII